MNVNLINDKNTLEFEYCLNAPKFDYCLIAPELFHCSTPVTIEHKKCLPPGSETEYVSANKYPKILLHLVDDKILLSRVDSKINYL